MALQGLKKSWQKQRQDEEMMASLHQAKEKSQTGDLRKIPFTFLLMLQLPSWPGLKNRIAWSGIL